MTNDPVAAPWALRTARGIKRARWAIIIVWLAAIVGGMMGGEKVLYDPDVLVYFDRAKPERQAFDAVEARFGQSREVVTLVLPQSGDVLAPAVLRAIADYEARVRARPEVSAVRSPLTQINLEPGAVRAMDDAALAEEASRLRALRAQDDGRLRTLLAEDASVAAVAAIVPDLLSNDEARAVARDHAQLKELARQAHPDVDFMQTGRIVIDDAFLRESQDDVTGYAGAQLGLLAALIFAALGSFSLSLGVMLLVFIALTGTVGTLGWLGIQVNGISSAAPVVLMGLMVASAIHVAMAWQEGLRRTGDKVSALAIALDRNAKPVVLSVATTLISFLLLNLAEAPPFRDLGNIVAAGLLGVLVLTFTLLPALLTVLPRSYGRHRSHFEAWLGETASFCARHRGTAMLVGFVVALASAAGVMSIRVDDTFSHYFDERYEIRQATDIFERKLSGTTIIDIAADTGMPGGALLPEAITRVEALSQWLEERPEVARIDSVVTLRDAVLAAGETPTADAIMDAGIAATREGVPRVVDEEGRHLRISIVMRGVSSRDTLDFRDAAQDVAADQFGAQNVMVTGLPILSAELSVGSARAMVVGMLLALLLISVLLIATLRDAWLGVISLVPNLLPVAMAFGLWGAFVGEVSFAATVVGALTYGIVVDDTVHLLAKYQRFRAELGNVLAAVRRAFASVGVAVVVTSLALAASFLPFALSGFLINRHFGALTALTLIGAMVADLLLLPALLAA
ncbi:MAG: MMPL family transporter, partial [Pseudomonadota bacterium]